MSLLPIPLIHNPSARSAKSARLGRMLARMDPAPRILVTDGPGSARAHAAECARRGDPVVVAAGGDGTVNEVVAGLLDAAAEGFPMPELGLMPLGTMNVFALELGLPVRSVRQCWDAVAGGATRTVDLWMVNGRPMVQLGGVGLDASVVAETSWEMKRRMGPFSYVVNAARVLARPAPQLTVTVDGVAVAGAMALLGNGKRYGGPLKVFPGAELDDGLAHVLVLRQQTTGDVLGFLAALATGSLEKFPGVWLARGREIDITSARDVPLELDGEPSGGTPVSVRPAPWRLVVRVPPVQGKAASR
jgi:YegS/Rv2252/BmrU family lipid kinase